MKREEDEWNHKPQRLPVIKEHMTKEEVQDWWDHYYEIQKEEDQLWMSWYLSSSTFWSEKYLP